MPDMGAENHVGQVKLDASCFTKPCFMSTMANRSREERGREVRIGQS